MNKDEIGEAHKAIQTQIELDHQPETMSKYQPAVSEAQHRYHKAANNLEEDAEFWVLINESMWRKILTALRIAAGLKEGEEG